MKKYLLFAALLLSCFSGFAGTGAVTIINSTHYTVTVEVEGVDPTYFGTNGAILTNTFNVMPGSITYGDPCQFVVGGIGYAVIPSPYACPLSSFSIQWRYARVTIGALSGTCGTPASGGVSATVNCGGFGTPTYICAGPPASYSLSWSSGCTSPGDDITITIAP